ncbi:unnamed protein product [Ilex paraguariensis]|uniref:Uncharacterized protein n=1 Tax=Ilex paraguariensis TaxID=185542 RepID=A0ABC8UM98_9AQUA
MGMLEFCIVEDGGDATYVSIPRGGPIYVPDMVGPLTRVPDFESVVFHQLQDLKAEVEELSSDSLEPCGEDISVDELKIITEEELVNKAFKEAFKDGEVGNSSQVPEEHVNAGRKDDSRISSHEHACLESLERERDGSTSIVSSNGSPLRTGDNQELSEDTLKKRKRKRRMNQKSHTLNGSYIAKVEQLARIKQKQDENKAAARLHSFK